MWVYTLVNTDYGGSQLLPHFFNYYHSLGMTWRRFLVLLHHTPGKYSRKGLEDAMGICSGYAVECRWGAGVGAARRGGWVGRATPLRSPVHGRGCEVEGPVRRHSQVAHTCRPARPAGRRVWEGQYSSEAHLEQQLGMLDDYVSDPTDWIMPVDVDEFVDFGGRFIK